MERTGYPRDGPTVQLDGSIELGVKATELGVVGVLPASLRAPRVLGNRDARDVAPHLVVPILDGAQRNLHEGELAHAERRHGGGQHACLLAGRRDAVSVERARRHHATTRLREAALGRHDAEQHVLVGQTLQILLGQAKLIDRFGCPDGRSVRPEHLIERTQHRVRNGIRIEDVGRIFVGRLLDLDLVVSLRDGRDELVPRVRNGRWIVVPVDRKRVHGLTKQPDLGELRVLLPDVRDGHVIEKAVVTNEERDAGRPLCRLVGRLRRLTPRLVPVVDRVGVTVAPAIESARHRDGTDGRTSARDGRLLVLDEHRVGQHDARPRRRPLDDAHRVVDVLALELGGLEILRRVGVAKAGLASGLWVAPVETLALVEDGLQHLAPPLLGRHARVALDGGGLGLGLPLAAVDRVVGDATKPKAHGIDGLLGSQQVQHDAAGKLARDVATRLQQVDQRHHVRDAVDDVERSGLGGARCGRATMDPEVVLGVSQQNLVALALHRIDVGLQDLVVERLDHAANLPPVLLLDVLLKRPPDLELLVTNDVLLVRDDGSVLRAEELGLATRLDEADGPGDLLRAIERLVVLRAGQHDIDQVAVLDASPHLTVQLVELPIHLAHHVDGAPLLPVHLDDLADELGDRDALSSTLRSVRHVAPP